MKGQPKTIEEFMKTRLGINPDDKPKTMGGNMAKNEWVDALNSNGDREFIKATDIEEGEAIEGKLVSISDNKKYEGKSYLHFQRADGTEFTLIPAGTLNYNIKDGKLAVGNEYRIIREGSKVLKNGKTTMTNFKVLTRPAANATRSEEKQTKKATPAF